MDINGELSFPIELVGQRIRKIRKQSGITIEELANKADLSQSMISQIELGQTKPSLETLWKLSYHLNTPIFSFIKNIEPARVIVLKKQNQKEIKMLHPNVKYRLLSPAIDEKLEVFELIVEPGEISHLPQLGHSGEEFGYIIKGELEVQIQEKIYSLESGDSIYFDSKLPHRFINRSNEAAKGVWIMF